jgi:nucleoside-triphosphatase THEP1
MKSSNKLNEVWLKASILGTTWAASEIVLGSFLHNLKVPFSGNILTGIGLIIMISASYKWHDRGLFWRSGLICAIMKTISPSAVIFGPMIAIFTEAALFDLSVRYLGRTLPGFFIGSILAMSWVLVQRIINFIIFYGYNIVEVYNNLINFAEKQLQTGYDLTWYPVFLLLIINSLFGIAAAIIGIRTGKSLSLGDNTDLTLKKGQAQVFKTSDNSNDFSFSISWLIIDFLVIIASLLSISYLPWYIWTVIILGIVIVWSIRYKQALRQLSKPKFWIFFVLITLITSLAFSSRLSIGEAIYIGIQMNFRAAVIILGFSVLGKELYNPRIRNFFHGSYFRQFPLALDLSFQTLPFIVSNLPDVKTIIKNPLSTVRLLINQAELRFNEMKNNHSEQTVFIISGKMGEGKTTYLKGLIDYLQKEKIELQGFYSPFILENETAEGYDLVDVKTNQREAFLRENAKKDYSRIGRFYILPQGLEFGIECLKTDNINENSIVLIDEVGNLELSDNGWAKSLENLLKRRNNHLILVVRTNFVSRVIEKWNLRDTVVIDISQTDFRAAGEMILNRIGEL